MDKTKLPVAPVATRPASRADVSDQAIKCWMPDLKAAEGETSETISILDPIGADWFGEGVTAKRISAALRSIGGADVTVNINSPGGDFFEGLAIYNLLREYSGRVTVNVIGLAASAASIISMAADEVKVARAGFIMIHNTWVLAAGDRNALRDVADWLAPFDDAQTSIFAARTGMDAKTIAKMLDAETWIGGDKAVEQGFADALLDSDAIGSSASASSDLSPLAAKRKIDLALAKASFTRTERGELLTALTGGKQDAVPPGTPGAAVADELNALVAKLKTI